MNVLPLIIAQRRLLAGYTANPVNFDGSADYLTRGADLTGVADGKEGLVSAWLRVTGSDGVNLAIAANDNLGGNFYIVRASSNKLQVAAQDVGGTLDLTINSSTSVIASSGWVHFLASWNLATGSAWIYLSDVSDLAGGSTLNNDTLDYTGSGNFGVGAEPDGGFKFAGDMADLYINFATYMDLSVEANRRKFISAAGKPVDLGSDGSTPTGSAPAVFCSGATADWHTNKGGGGGFTENGALTDGTGPVEA